MNTLSSKVKNAKIKISFTRGVLKASTSEVEGCKYAFYLLKNGSVVEKSFYSENNIRSFSKPFLSGAVYSVKVFFKCDGDVSTRLSKEIKGVQSETSVNPMLNEFTLQNCEIIQSGVEKIEQYEAEGFKPRADCKPYKLKLPIDWLEDPFDDKNWMYQLNAWRMLDPYLTRFNKYDRELVKLIINDWVRYEKNNSGKWLWYDMSTGLRALKISYYLQGCVKESLDHGIDDLDYLVSRHLEYLSNPKELNTGNHGLFQLNGLKSLIFIFEDLSNFGFSKEALSSYSSKEMERLIMRQLGTKGVHTEDSPDYHFFAHKKISSIIESPWWKDIDKNILELLRMGESAKPWLVFPNKRCVPVGDSSCGSNLKINSSLNDWPHIRGDKTVGAKIDGYAVIRSEEKIPVRESSFLFLQGSFYSQTHKHCDDLSLIWQECGRNILIDPGKYGYKQDKFRKYFLSTPAHNTITVDGVSTARESKYAYGSAIEEEPVFNNGIWALKAHVDHKKNKYSHTRSIFYRPGCDLYVVDSLINYSMQDEREISLWWHLDDKANIQKLLAEKGEVKVDIDFLSSDLFIKAYISTDSVAAVAEEFKGHEGASLAGWVSKAYLKAEPTPCFRVSTNFADKRVILTRFLLEESAQPILELQDGTLKSSESWILDQLKVPVENNELVKEKKDDAKGEGLFINTKWHQHYGFEYSLGKGVSHFFKKSISSKKLLVTFHGSISPPRNGKPATPLPIFRLHDLNIENQPNVLCFSDRLLEKYKKDSVYLSWFLDTAKYKQSSLIIDIIQYYCDLYKFDDVIFHGSSGGGFPSIRFASHFGKTAIVSNAQFILDQHSQFKDLAKAVKLNDDHLLSYDLESNIRDTVGPNKIVSYCNVDDYTFKHHEHANSVVESFFPGVVIPIFFSGDKIAKEKGVRNHSVQYPEGQKISQVLSQYLAEGD